MCGRIYIQPSARTQQLLRDLNLESVELPALFNVVPTETVPVIHRADGALQLSPMRWWLHPHWSREAPNQKFAMFNARIETVETSRAYKGPFKYRRGIIPATGYVEWRKEGSLKQPYYFETTDFPLALACIWDVWHEELQSCSVITLPANATAEAIHTRMPGILQPDLYEDWLSPESDPLALKKALSEASVELTYRAVTTRINNARHKIPVEELDE